MRRILSAAAYEHFLKTMSANDLEQAATAFADAAKKLIRDHSLRGAALLCASPLEQLAFAAAEQLKKTGIQASVYLLSRDEFPVLSQSLICDCLFDPCLDEVSLIKRGEWINAMMGSDCPILSTALPAGIDPDTGKALGQAVRAEITLSPGGYLSGLFLHDGLDHSGQIVPVAGETDTTEMLVRFEESDAKRLLPPRRRTAHKGDSGKALLCVGSPRYVGAALLSARACLAAGCGILYVACPNAVKEALGRLPEAIGIDVGQDWNRDSSQIAIQSMTGMKTVGIGCGIGNGDVSSLLEAALLSKRPIVLDADGLNCLSSHPELYPMLHDKVVLTPHPGEMSRLTGLSLDRVLEDPVDMAVRFAGVWGCIVLLKGAATVVSDGKRACLLAEGNAGLGKGGSGDVLTGIITGLMAQGIEPFDAACLSSYLLGASAEKAFVLLRERMLQATNVIEALEDIVQ